MISRLGLWITLLFAVVPHSVSDEYFAHEDLMERVERVSGGDLRFLSAPPDKPVHHHENRIRILDSSLHDGWVSLRQCHTHLDPVPELQIVYNADRTRHLRILQFSDIDAARVEGASVQLEHIRPGARICLSAHTRALWPHPGGRLQLRNGPFMRRFLDGYYPMQVSLDISYPLEKLRLEQVQPAASAGFNIRKHPGRVRAKALFEGRLNTRLTFCRKGQGQCANRVE